MVDVFLGLRLRLLLARLDTPARTIGWGAGCALVGVIGGFAAVFAYALGVAPEQSLQALRVSATAVLASWTFAPVLAPFAGGGDQSLEVRRYATLPVRGRDIGPGLLVAGFLSPLAWATVVVVVVLAASHVRTGVGAGVAAVAAVLFVFICIGGNRAASVILSVVSRRARRMTAVVVLMVAATVGAVAWWGGGTVVDAIVQWNPAGRVADALRRARSGDAVAGATALVVPTLYSLVLLVVLVRAVDRAMTDVVPAATGRTRSLLPLLAGALPLGDARARARFGAGMILTWRDPVRWVNWLLALLLGVVVPAYLLSMAPTSDGTFALLPVVGAFLIAGGTNINTFGLDGSAVWEEVVSGEMRGPVLGRLLVTVSAGLPVVLTAAVIAGALAGSVMVLVAASVVAVGSLLALAGTGLALGARFPVRPPPNPFAPSPDVSVGNGLPSAAANVATLLAIVPCLWLIHEGIGNETRLGVVLGGTLVLAVGGASAAVGVRSARRHLDRHQPELLERLEGQVPSRRLPQVATAPSAPPALSTTGEP